MGFLKIFLCASVFSVGLSFEVCEYRVANCDGDQLDCYRSLPCKNGRCDGIGNCLCDLCWTGSHCDQYVDNYEATFLSSPMYVTLSSVDSGVLFTVSAYDEDLALTCHNSPDCLCAQRFYYLRAGSTNHPFSLDSSSGEVHLVNGKNLEPGTNFSLIISVQNNESSTWKRNDENTLEVVVTVDEYSVLENPIEDDKLSYSHRLAKRDADPTSTVTIQISQVNPNPRTLYVTPGDRSDYQLDITVADGASTELQVEIYSLDPIAKKTAFALIEAGIKTVGSGLTTSVTTNTVPILTPCSDMPSINNQIVFDIGSVTAGSGNNVLSIVFSSVFLNTPSYVFNEGNYSILIGVSYDSDSFVWIAQAEFNADIIPPQAYLSSMNVEGPDSVDIDSYALFTANVYTASPVDDYQLDVFGYSTPPDSYSAGGIVLASAGYNFPLISNNSYSYWYESLPSSSENTTSRNTLILTSLYNTDDFRNVSNLTTNQLVFNFVVYVLNNENLVASDMSFACTLMIGGITIWTNLINVTLTARESTAVAQPTSMNIRNATVYSNVGGATRAYIDIVIPESNYCDVLLEITAPTSIDPDLPIITLCDFTTSNGANIPYVAPVSPVINGSTMILDFGRIWNSKLIPSNVTAGTLTVVVIVRAESSLADGQQVSVKLGSLSQSFTVSITNSQLMEESDIHLAQSSLMDIFNSTSIAPEAETAVNLTLSFPSNVSFSNVMLELASNFANETVFGRICRAQVLSVGTIPCLNKRVLNSGIQYNYSGNLQEFSTAFLNLGGICIANGNLTDEQIVIQVSFEVLEQSTAVPGNTFRLYSGISSASASVIWTSSLSYGLTATSNEILLNNYQPVVYAYLAPDSPSPMPNQVVLVYFNILIPPLSRSNYTLQINSPTCKMSVILIGINFPCVRTQDLKASMIYDNYDPSSSSYYKSSLAFGWVANTGNDLWLTDNTVDGNSIVISAAVKVMGPVVYSLIYTSSSVSGSLPLDVSPLPAPSTQSISQIVATNLTTFDGSNTISSVISDIIVLQLQLNDTLSNVSVNFNNSNQAANDYVFCSAAVTTVGANLPCINGTSFSPQLFNNSQSGNCSNSLSLQLGTICQIAMTDDLSANMLVIEVAVNVLSSSVSTISIDSTVNSDSTVVSTNSLMLTVDNSPKTFLTCNLTAFAVPTNTSLSAGVGEKTVMQFNLSIPYNCTTAVTVAVSTPSIAGRATMTVTRLIFLAAGINVACVLNTSLANFTTADLITSQKNLATLDLGFITNTGITGRRGSPVPEDDQLSFEVEVLMGDHPAANANSNQAVVFSVLGTAVTVNQIVVLQRFGTEVPNISVAASVVNQKLFRRNDLVYVQLILSHFPLSSAEPLNTIVRLFLPPYINYTGIVSSNGSIQFSDYNYVLLTLTDPFLLEEVFEVNITLMVDPYDKRGPGADMVNATSVGSVIAKLSPQTIAGSVYPTTDIVYAGLHSYFAFGIIAEGCDDALGMQNGGISDCQLSSSTSADASSGPAMARLGRNAGEAWKPALRANSTFKDYLQIDFGNKTRVSKVEFEKDSCCRAPSSVLLESSDTGFAWNYLHQVNALNYSGGTVATVELPNSFEGRWLRVVILTSEEVENQDIKYTGLRLEFYGCTLENDIPFKTFCDTNFSPSLFSDDVDAYRHFSIDEQQNVIYGCDFLTNSLSLGCFCSADGNTWTAIPISSVTSIIGYDTSSGFTFGHRNGNNSIFKSSDCEFWLTTNEDELNTVMSGNTFVKSQVLPGRPRDDPTMQFTVGRWIANYDGIYLDNNIRLSWN